MYNLPDSQQGMRMFYVLEEQEGRSVTLVPNS